jgi:dTDP-4-amino-4,6-dideoxygalactose transaminase
MKIPFLSLKKLNAPYLSQFHADFEEFLERGFYMLHDNVRSFETEFAEFCSAKYAIGVANGLDALEMILESLDLPPGSEIIVPANTYFASILSIVNCGLTPVLVEPDERTFLISTESILNALSPKTKGVLAVNLYGRMCDYQEIAKICKAESLYLVVDAAQSHDALYDGSRDCPGADAIAYSFYPTKNLGALADAGAVVTQQDWIAERVRCLRNYGSTVRYQFEHKGRNSRLSELQAGFLRTKLKGLPEETRKRRAIAGSYIAEIHNPKLELPLGDRLKEDAWHLFVLKTENRNQLIKHLEKAGIGYDIHYPKAPHQQNAFAEYRHYKLPITERIHEQVISIPLNGSLTTPEVNYIIETLNNF